jgi:hypothetical protein
MRKQDLNTEHVYKPEYQHRTPAETNNFDTQ